MQIEWDQNAPFKVGQLLQIKCLKLLKSIFSLSILLVFLLIYTSFGTGHFLYTLLFIGLAGFSVYAAMSYTIGNKAYGYKGLGDVFVFVFFGFVSVVGSYFLYTRNLSHQVFLPAITIGLLSVGVLNLNNMRDIDSDKQSNKIDIGS